MSRDAERSLRVSDPWSLLRNSDRWRRNPLIDDGHYFTTGVQLEYDTRNDRDRPTTGWMIRTRFEHSTSDDIAPVALPGISAADTSLPAVDMAPGVSPSMPAAMPG